MPCHRCRCPRITPRSSIFTTGAMPDPSFRLLDGLWATPAPAFFKRAHLALVHVDAMRREHARVEQPLLRHPRHHRHAVLAPRLLHLERGFREMRVERDAELDGQLRAGAQDFDRARVRSMRRGRGDDQRVPFPARDEVARAGERILEARRIRRRKLEHRLRAEGAHAGGGRGFGHGLLEVVHVGEARSARADHLGAREPGAERDELRRHELALDRHHVAHQPDVEPQIVREAAQERHRRVRVGVDQARHHDAAAAVDGLGGLVARLDRAHLDNRARRDRHGARIPHREVLVHGDDVGVGQQRDRSAGPRD